MGRRPESGEGGENGREKRNQRRCSGGHHPDVFDGGSALAHCDTLDGPVISQAGRRWRRGREDRPAVGAADKEKEIREAFDLVAAVRGKGRRRKSSRTGISSRHWCASTGKGRSPLHGAESCGDGLGPRHTGGRQGAGVRRPPPAPVPHQREGPRRIHKYYMAAKEKKAHAGESVEAGRAYVNAYVPYLHFVERSTPMPLPDCHGGGEGDMRGQRATRSRTRIEPRTGGLKRSLQEVRRDLAWPNGGRGDMPGKPLLALCAFIVVLALSFPAYRGWATEDYARETGRECVGCHLDPRARGAQQCWKSVSRGPGGSRENAPGFLPVSPRGPVRRRLPSPADGCDVVRHHPVRSPSPQARICVPGFAPRELIVGWGSIVLIAVTGTILTFYRVPSTDALLHTRFGMLLMAKIGIFLVMTATAFIVTFVIGPRLKARHAKADRRRKT